MMMKMTVATYLSDITVGVVRICVRVLVAVPAVAVLLPLVVFLHILLFLLLLLHRIYLFNERMICPRVRVVCSVTSVIALLFAVAEPVQTLTISICRCYRAVQLTIVMVLKSVMAERFTMATMAGFTLAVMAPMATETIKATVAAIMRMAEAVMVSVVRFAAMLVTVMIVIMILKEHVKI